MQGPNNGGQVITEPPFPELSPQEQQYIDQLLKVWEEKTAGIDRFSADFLRWEYDSHAPGVADLAKRLGRSDIHIAAGKGVIRFQKPDKGLFRTDKYFKATGNVGANNDVELLEDKQNFGEYVICDGKNVWDYDRKEKICTRMELPPEMQGLGIMNSPLPFLFGVKAEEIKARYWVRAISPGNQPNGQPYTDRYAVEAYPKYPVDAVNYHHVQIVLDREQFLPFAMILYMPEWSDKSIQENGVVIEPRDKRMFYQFDNRRSNANIFQLINEKLFLQEFIPTEPPSDWKKNDIPYVPPAVPAATQDPAGQRTANPALPAGPTVPRAR
jgi:TIGR03009 family protein